MFLGVGTSIITAVQEGNSNFYAAPNITQTITVSSAVDVFNSNREKVSFNIYPNPISNQLFVDYALNEKSNVALDIFNIQGKLVKSLMCSHPHDAA